MIARAERTRKLLFGGVAFALVLALMALAGFAGADTPSPPSFDVGQAVVLADDPATTNPTVPKLGDVRVEKRVVGGPAGAVFPAAVSCHPADDPLNALGDASDTFGDGDVLLVEDVPANWACVVVEDLVAPGWVLTGTVNGASQTILQQGTIFGFGFHSTGGGDTVVLTNCYVSDPYTTNCVPAIPSN